MKISLSIFALLFVSIVLQTKSFNFFARFNNISTPLITNLKKDVVLKATLEKISYPISEVINNYFALSALNNLLKPYKFSLTEKNKSAIYTNLSFGYTSLDLPNISESEQVLQLDLISRILHYKNINTSGFNNKLLKITSKQC